MAQLVAVSVAPAEPLRPARTAPGPREMVVVNRSARPVYQLRISPSDADQWGDDRLGDDTIPAGGTYKVRLGRTRDCQFDVQVVYDDSSREERFGVDVCRQQMVSFDRSAAIMPPDPEAGNHVVRLVNQSPRAIGQVFMSSANADRWGDDLAPAGGIAAGKEGVVTYYGGCVADLRVVFDNRAAEERRDIDICDASALLIRPGWTTADAPPTPPRAEAPAGSVVLENDTGSAITELYLSPEDPSVPVPEGAPSGDLLGNAILPAGGRLPVPFMRGTECRFVAHIRHGGDQPEQVQNGIDLCHSSTIALEAPHSG